MGSLFGLAQSELGAANNDFDLVGYPVGDETVNRQGSRNSINQGQHVGTEVFLQLGVLVEVVQNHAGNRIAL